MDDFKTDMLEMRARMNSKIEEHGVNYIASNKVYLFSLYPYKGKNFEEYFKSTGLEEKRIIIEILMEKPYAGLMEELVTKLLNSAMLEQREQLTEIFNGIEQLLTENISTNVVVKSIVIRSKETAESSIKVTIMGVIISILLLISCDYVRQDYMVYVFLLTVLLTAASALVATIANKNYKSNLNERKKLGSQEK